MHTIYRSLVVIFICSKTILSFTKIFVQYNTYCFSGYYVVHEITLDSKFYTIPGISMGVGTQSGVGLGSINLASRRRGV